MKEVNATETLRKTQKYANKVFKNDEDNDLVEELLTLLKVDKVKNAVTMYDQLASSSAQDRQPLDAELLSSVQSNLDDLYDAAGSNEDAAELCDILSTPYFRSFIDAYEDIAKQNYEPEIPKYKEPQPIVGGGNSGMTPDSPMMSGKFIGGDDYERGNSIMVSNSALNGPNAPNDPSFGMRPQPMEETMKMVGIRKEPGEEMGVTVIRRCYKSPETGPTTDIIVERIMTGSTVDQQDLLHPGDIIREVNGVPVDSPELLQKLFRQATGVITLKIIPAPKEDHLKSQLFLRAHFTYNPEFDGLIPCKQAGLKFQTGDILQICQQDDPHWWQARKFGTDNRAGLIPSVTLQERRKAFIQSAPDPDEIEYTMFGCGIGRKKKKAKVLFRAREAENYESHDVVVYEEVARIPGFIRHVICLVGARGIGRRTLRDKLIEAYPDKYEIALPHTSRAMRPSEKSGDRYYFANRTEMQTDMESGLYVEMGELNGNLYGIKLDTIRQIYKKRKTCLLECSEKTVRRLRTSEFMPYVIFIAAPSVDTMRAMYEYGRSMGLTEKIRRDEDFRLTVDESIQMESSCRHLFDYVVVNDNMDVCFENLKNHTNDLRTEPQWVPAMWLY